MTKVSIVLPTRNEVQTIGRLIDELNSLPYDLEILVVDYKSTDGTREVVLSKGVRLIDEGKRGKGAALIRGFKEATGEYVVTLDSDGTYPVSYIVQIVTLLRLSCEAVLGWRKYRAKGAMFSVHVVGNYLLSLLASILYFSRIRDVNTGMRGFRRFILPQLALAQQDFTIEADIFISLVKGGHYWREIPISYSPRVKDSKPKLNFWDGLKIGWYLVKRRFK